jgi:hypothetical protein
MHFSLIVQNVLNKISCCLFNVVMSPLSWVFGMVFYIFLVPEMDTFFMLVFLLGILITAALGSLEGRDD